MTHPLQTTVEDLVANLVSLKRETITTELVTRCVDATPVGIEALKEYIWWRDEFYTRNLIYRDDLFEVMAICWKAGQKTPIHTHNGQLGWMTVPQGEVVIENYHHESCNAPENQNVVNIDCLGGATEIHLDRVGLLRCNESSDVAIVSKTQSIHRILNTDPAAAGCVSLHIYSKPFDSCIAFDLEHQRCFRRTLSYFSRYGKVEAEAGH
jgi:cysteine dioxygenase